MTNRDRGFSDREFRSLLGEFRRLAKQAEREEWALAIESLARGVLEQLEVPPADRSDQEPRLAFEGTQAVCAGLADVSIASVDRAKEATEMLDNTIVALLEVESRVRAVRSVVSERMGFGQSIDGFEPARMAPPLGQPSAGSLNAGLVRPQ